MAIVIAFAFAFELNTPWLPFTVFMNTVYAKSDKNAKGGESTWWFLQPLGSRWISVVYTLVALLILAIGLMFFVYLRRLRSMDNVRTSGKQQDEVVRLLSDRADDDMELRYYSDLHDRVLSNWRKRNIYI